MESADLSVAWVARREANWETGAKVGQNSTKASRLSGRREGGMQTDLVFHRVAVLLLFEEFGFALFGIGFSLEHGGSLDAVEGELAVGELGEGLVVVVVEVGGELVVGGLRERRLARGHARDLVRVGHVVRQLVRVVPRQEKLGIRRARRLFANKGSARCSHAWSNAPPRRMTTKTHRHFYSFQSE